MVRLYDIVFHIDLINEYIAGMDLGELISRASGRPRISQSEHWALMKTSTFRVIGRHVLNLWRIMRSELNLSSYTFENAVFHVLRRRYAL